MASQCKECNETIKGRSDKQFCSDYCRVNYYNKSCHDELKMMRQTNKILRSNRRILKRLKKDGNDFISMEALIVLGFQINFVTYIDSDPETLRFYCYEYGIELLEADQYMIIKNNTMEFSR